MVEEYCIIYFEKPNVGWVSLVGNLGMPIKFEDGEQARVYIADHAYMFPGNTQIVRVTHALFSCMETREQFRTKSYMLV